MGKVIENNLVGLVGLVHLTQSWVGLEGVDHCSKVGQTKVL